MNEFGQGLAILALGALAVVFMACVQFLGLWGLLVFGGLLAVLWWFFVRAPLREGPPHD